MRTETETRITSWETQPVESGYAGLHALAEAAFSGAITANETWLFMLDGRPIGLSGGPIESFSEGVSTAYVTAHPALPLLFAMRERGGETTARYYTDDTPLADTAETLSENGFTGYVELSENVLSGEYYLVYHRGRSIPVAFVGEGSRLLTDDEAVSRANEEVGIYEVTAVALEELDLPEPPEEPTTADSSSPGSPPTGDGERLQDLSTSATEPTETANAHASARPSDAPDPVRSDADEPSAAASETPVGMDPTGAAGTMSHTGVDGNAIGEGGGDDRDVDDRPACDGQLDRSVDPVERWGSVVEEPVEERFAAERQWREAVRIPSPKPEPSSATTANAAPGSETGSHSPEVATDAPAPRASPDEPEVSVDEFETERRARETTEAEADRLREEVAALRDRLETLETDDVTGPQTEDRAESIPPSRALSGTDLFVRYTAADEPTLESAHSSGADRATVGGNLRLECHTGFDPSNVLVADRPLEEFLEGRIERRFADWLISALLFDLRETGHENGLEQLYDALPRIDRIDFGGAVDAGEEGDLTFDVVFRNRMGEPLIVADCVDTREPIGEKRVASLVRAANGTKGNMEKLAGAMLATTSFFDPGALETAAEATRSGLLGRTVRESYVTLSRRSGYHLCLIEMRDAFHVRVPEL